ncbi:hypothetical protein E4T56_gene19428 [Termitomyces sp. T112]|nr:hypothetical protein E4T56_gene19428 [Termitomyces sp. T112]
MISIIDRRRRARRVPSLACLCLRVLARYPAHVPIDIRLNYDSRLGVDLLDDILDPPLWATLVQVYDGLPEHLHSLTIPLTDPNVPCLQKIPQTSLFSLITVLDLPACPHLTDTSIVHLGPLHSLVALDASATSLSSYAIKVLSGTLLWFDDGPQRRGPWSLRILRLRFCDKIDDSVYSHLAKFPLLAVIDLRGTKCRPPKDEMKTFKPSSRLEFFHPAPLAAAVDALEGQSLYTSKNFFYLLIDSLEHSKVAWNFPQHTMKQNKCSHDTVMESTAVPWSSMNQHGLNPNTITLESTPSMFYSQPSRSSRPVKYDLINDYKAKTYYTWAHLEAAARPSGTHDTRLALCRIPPPWIALEKRSTFLLNQMEARRSTKDEAVSCVASINRTERIFQINQPRIDALRESASTRRRSGVGAPINTPKSKQASGVRGKNPFRRYSLPGVVGDPDRGMKDLKPISAVEVPKFPSSLKSDGDEKHTYSNAFAKTPGVKSSPFVETSLNRTKPAAFHSTWSGRSDSPLRATKRTALVDSLRTDVKKPRVDGGSAFSNNSDKGKEKSIVQDKRSFDWNTWSAK